MMVTSILRKTAKSQRKIQVFEPTHLTAKKPTPPIDGPPRTHQGPTEDPPRSHQGNTCRPKIVSGGKGEKS